MVASEMMTFIIATMTKKLLEDVLLVLHAV
jgi:hypothetical protein